jgi:hypothetical protein
MTMGGMAETTVANGKAEAGEINDLRLHYNDKLDEIHFHDDKAGLKFVFKGRRAFVLGMNRFLNAVCNSDNIYMVVGDVGHKGAADLFIEMAGDEWKFSLVEKGKATRTADAVIPCDRNLAKLDDFLQRIP